MICPTALAFCLWVVASRVRATPWQDCKQVLYQKRGSVPDSQNLSSPAFIGSPAKGQLTTPKWTYLPEASLLHTDSGNTGSSDYSGPLGIDPDVTSSTASVNVLLWGSDGSLTAGYVNASAGSSPSYGFVALDPKSFEVLASWYPPGKQMIGFAYTEYLQKTNDILLGTKENQIFVVHRDICNGVPIFTTTRTYNLTNILQTGEKLLNNIQDTAGNIWFTSGAILGTGDVVQNSTTLGYITPDGEFVYKHIENEFVENGIAVSGLNVFIVTGPSGVNDKPNATGYMYSFTSDGNKGIETRWKVPYDAGSGKATSALSVTSRGAGSTPALLNDQYVAITDKSDSRIHVNVYHQSPKDAQLVCQYPIFQVNQSNNDNGIIVHFDGETFGMLVQNDFNGPPIYGGDSSINGNFNDMGIMPGGMARVDVNQNGQCSLRWTSDLTVKAVSILSTKTSILYNYVQDIKSAGEGEYVWYVAGVDWYTGKTIFKIRTGAGGAYNDNWGGGTIGPDGTFYQAIIGGVVAVKDR